MTLDFELLSQLVDDARLALNQASTLAEVEEIVGKYGGKRSRLADANQALRGLPDDERPIAGRRLGKLRAQIADVADARRIELGEVEAKARLESERIDLTLPGMRHEIGYEHLISRTIAELVDVFVGMGYEVAEGNEVETDYYNFEALNIPRDHPARSMQDTLYVETEVSEEILLRTQTSGVQIHVMEATEPPLYMVAPGRVFRQEALDPSHSPVFHQMEGLAVDSDLTLGDLAGTLRQFTREYFGKNREIKLRPSYFPFTEPSAEVAMSCYLCDGSGCRTCGQSGWIEILGAGMVDPNVFEAVGYDPERWTGFAFGMGIERIALLRYGIPDIRLLYENDLRFLSQF